MEPSANCLLEENHFGMGTLSFMNLPEGLKDIVRRGTRRHRTIIVSENVAEEKGFEGSFILNPDLVCFSESCLIGF